MGKALERERIAARALKSRVFARFALGAAVCATAFAGGCASGRSEGLEAPVWGAPGQSTLVFDSSTVRERRIAQNWESDADLAVNSRGNAAMVQRTAHAPVGGFFGNAGFFGHGYGNAFTPSGVCGFPGLRAGRVGWIRPGWVGCRGSWLSSSLCDPYREITNTWISPREAFRRAYGPRPDWLFW